MYSNEIKNIIKEYEFLFWYTPYKEKQNISLDLLVETILNYGDLEAVRKLITVLGIQQTANVFFNAQKRKKLNYYPEIHNYFSLYFKKYA